MKKLFTLALATAFIVSLGVGCSGSTSPSKATPIKVGGGTEDKGGGDKGGGDKGGGDKAGK